MNPLSIYRRAITWGLGILLLLLGVGAWAGAPKLISDVGLIPQNSDDITGTAFQSHYYSLKINDGTGYSPHVPFTNSGTMVLLNLNITGFSEIRVISNTNSSVILRNSGMVDVSYAATNQLYRTYGIHTAGSLENSGAVSMTAIRPSHTFISHFYGIQSQGQYMVNSGDIRMDITAGNNMGQALGVGLEFTGNSLINGGDILVNAVGNSSALSGWGTGTAKGIYTQGDLVNTGAITLTAVAGVDTNTNLSEDATAYGIETVGNLSLDSRGLIRVEALPAPGYGGGTQDAYQVYVTSGTTTITGYAMELAHQAQLTETYHGAIGVAGGGSVTFSDAVLHLTIPDQFSIEEIYELPMLVEGAPVSDQFARLGSLPPEYKATLVDGGGGSLQKVRFFFGPEDSVALMASQLQNEFDGQIHAMLGDQILIPVLFDRLPPGTLPTAFRMPDHPQAFLAGLDGPVPARKYPELDRTMVFAVPLLLTSHRDHSTRGYGAERNGFLTGLTHEVALNRLYLGAHAGLGRTEVDYTGAGFEHRFDRSRGYLVGGHGLYRMDGDWLVSGMASLFLRDTDYADHAPNNRERAGYDALAFRAEVKAGRILNLARHHFIPEAGLSFLWNRRDAFTTENLDNPDVTHGRMDAWDLYGRLGIRYVTAFTSDSGRVFRPLAGFSLTRVLTDGDYASILVASEIPRKVVDTVDRTTAALDLSLSTDATPFDITVGFSMTLSEESENHFFWLKMGRSF